MAIKLRHNGAQRVIEWHATGFGSMNVTDVYRVRFLGRGLWRVVREGDEYKWTLTTSRIQRFFRAYSLESLYDGVYERVKYTVE